MSHRRPPVNFVERALPRRTPGRSLPFVALLLFGPAAAIAQAPIASSNFAGVENPLSEGGLWQPTTSMSPNGVQFQKNNAAFPNNFVGNNNHAGARTTAAVPNDHYSEIVVGHIGNNMDYVGAFVRLQASGPSIDSGYLWWGTNQAGAPNNFLYRIVADGHTYTAAKLIDHPPFADGDRVRLIARGPVIYGIRNGVREFILNTGPDGRCAGCPP